jgi:nucleotide-binding universal stress UspA family protein
VDEVVEAWSWLPEVVGGVVVGHDGSAVADGALGWALEDAARRGCAVHVVRAWMLASAIDDVGAPPGTVPSMQECADATLRHLEADVAAVVGRSRVEVPVACHAVHGPAGPRLVASSAAADLLVVGHRGRGHLAGLVLGSAAEYAVRHAACAVTVVRA